MNQSILFPYTSDRHLDLCRSALLTIQDNKERIMDGLTQNRNMQFDIRLINQGDYKFYFDHNEPLCDMLLDYFIVDVDKESIFQAWEHFTGSVTFIVDGSYDEFRQAYSTKSLWLNPKRWALVEYLIDCINKELDR